VLVFSNSAVSLDGKLGTPGYDHVSLGSREDLRRMSLLRARADAVLVGGRTWRAWSLPLVEDPAVVQVERARPVINAVLTRSGQGPRQGRFFDDARTRPLILGGPQADLRDFPASVTTCRSEGPSTVAWALQELRRDHGARRILVEGGGDLIWQLLERDLLDELNVTLCPVIVGGRKAPTLVDGQGFGPQQLRKLQLIAHEVVGQEIFLRYRVAGSR